MEFFFRAEPLLSRLKFSCPNAVDDLVSSGSNTTIIYITFINILIVIMPHYFNHERFYWHCNTYFYWLMSRIIIILYLSYIRAACTCVRSQRKMCSLMYIDLLKREGILPKNKRLINVSVYSSWLGNSLRRFVVIILWMFWFDNLYTFLVKYYKKTFSSTIKKIKSPFFVQSCKFFSNVIHHIIILKRIVLYKDRNF